MKYIKKPIAVEAEQFTGNRPYPKGVCDCDLMLQEMRGHRPHVHTIEGNSVYVFAGEWVIQEIDKEHYYTNSDEFFRAIYELTETCEQFNARIKPLMDALREYGEGRR